MTRAMQADSDCIFGHWNHRLVQRTYPDCVMYGIYEVFYNEDGSVWCCTRDPVDVSGETPEDVKQTLEWMLNCLDKPILEYNDIKDPDGLSEDHLEEDFDIDME